MKIGLKAGERLFINGAVIRAERKTNIELLNDAVFLLEAHVLQPEEATTPLRQLYFILQTMIIDPVSARAAQDMFHLVLGSIKSAFSNEEILKRLDDVEELAKTQRWFEAMKVVRGLYPVEAVVMDARQSEDETASPDVSAIPAGNEFSQRPQLAVV
ncbi:flagellar biosynthesis repressor FlbT [Roseibium sp. SCPC15]|jgi:flagellar protein FlbT|uniref:flagellar biosynthesis repressor FlbT n=1 Tax=Roseibium sp. SCP15 TaxID=3141376 RepID=UPI00333DF883